MLACTLASASPASASVSGCAHVHQVPFDVALPSEHAEMKGTVSFLCRSAKVVGMLRLTGPSQPAPTASGAIYGWAEAKSPALGTKALPLTAANDFVTALPGEHTVTVTFDSGWKRPANAAGDVGTVVVGLGFGPAAGQFSTQTLHQPTFGPKRDRRA